MQIVFPERTLTDKQQAVVDLANQVLSAHPDDPEMRRLAAYMLEVADVAPQREIAEAVGYTSDRTIRHIRDRVTQQGLNGLLEGQSGRPAVTTLPEVERAVIQEILSAVPQERPLPTDAELAERANRRLAQAGYEGALVTEGMAQTIRLQWEVKRPVTRQSLNALPDHASDTETISLGYSQWAGTFVLLAILIRDAWLRYAHLLTIAPNYAVTPEQLLLTAIFAAICGVGRAFHLDDVRDVGFTLLVGRVRPLAHSTFQHLIHALSLRDVVRFYRATSQQQVDKVDEGDFRVSMDGHTIPCFSKIVDLPKGRIGSTARIEKADNVLTAFELDARIFLTLRVRRGAKQLHRVVFSMTREILRMRKGKKGLLRLFLDRGAFYGYLFYLLKAIPNVHFYTPAVRYPHYVEEWERLQDSDFEPTPFVFDRDQDLPPEKQVSYRLADRKMEINVRKNNKLLGTVTLRSIILFNPLGKTASERWFVLLTDNEHTPARQLANEYGDHWGHESAHCVGKNDLYYDILPPSYTLESQRDEDGKLVRTVKLDIKNTFLMAWLRCLTFSLMSALGNALDGKYVKVRAGTLLRKFVRRPGTLFLVGNELHIVLDSFREQQDLLPLLERLNQECISVPWLNGVVLQFFIDEEQPLYPLSTSEKRKRFFEKEESLCPS